MLMRQWGMMSPRQDPGLALNLALTTATTSSGLISSNGHDVTFDRNSAATRRNSSGDWEQVAADIARLNHDAAGNPLGLLVEEQRTNLFLNSDAAANQTISITATGNYTLTVWGTGSVAVAANTATGTGFGTATDGSPVTFNISGTGTIDLTVTGSPDFVNVEAGSFGTSPILTAGVSATRAAESASIATSAFAFNQNAGTMVSEFQRSVTSKSGYIWEIHDGTASERFISLIDASDKLNMAVVDGGATQVFDAYTTTFTADAAQKHAFAWAVNDFAHTLNGGSIETDSTGTLPTVTTLGIGHWQGGGTLHFNGHIKSLRYYNTRKPNSFLVSETA